MWLPTCSEEEAWQHGGHLMHAGQLYACDSRFNTAMHTGGKTVRCLWPDHRMQRPLQLHAVRYR